MVRREHFCISQLRNDYLTIRPDLVVEVISPNDSAYEVDEKLEEYLAISIPLIWIVNPETRTVEINRPDGTATRLHASAEITGEDVLPGFHCRSRRFFQPRPRTRVQEAAASPLFRQREYARVRSGRRRRLDVEFRIEPSWMA
jgi:hypothetical protein